jgi:hypothetical protein
MWEITAIILTAAVKVIVILTKEADKNSGK